MCCLFACLPPRSTEETVCAQQGGGGGRRLLRGATACRRRRSLQGPGGWIKYMGQDFGNTSGSVSLQVRGRWQQHSSGEVVDCQAAS